MKPEKLTFSDTYTCKVSGLAYQYDADYTTGTDVAWNARIFQDGDLKGAPGGSLIGNTMSGDALRQYLIATIESLIEKGLGIAE